MRRIGDKAIASFAFLAILLSFFIQQHDRTAGEQRNDKASLQRSLDTCRRSNPGRAYLQLRAREVKSSTASDARSVFAILNCAATVRNHGAPIPLPGKVQDQYLRDFEARWVDKTREGNIIGRTSFDVYFSGNGGRRP